MTYRPHAPSAIQSCILNGTTVRPTVRYQLHYFALKGIIALVIAQHVNFFKLALTAPGNLRLEGRLGKEKLQSLQEVNSPQGESLVKLKLFGQRSLSHFIYTDKRVFLQNWLTPM